MFVIKGFIFSTYRKIESYYSGGVRCPFCGTPVDNGYVICTGCGAVRVSDKASKFQTALKNYAIAMIAISVIGYILLAIFRG